MSLNGIQECAEEILLSKKDGIYRNQWRRLVKSGTFLCMIISLSICAIALWTKVNYDVFNQLLVSYNYETLFQVTVKSVAFGVPGMAMLVNAVGYWLIRGKSNGTEKSRKLGLGMIFWSYVAVLIVTVLCFVLTLPAFTEWIPYQKAYSQWLQIIYCIYGFALVYCVLAAGVIKKMRDNLTFWEGASGPVVAFAVIGIVLSLGVLYMVIVATDFWTAAIGMSAFIHLVMRTVFLFRYRSMINRA